MRQVLNYLIIGDGRMAMHFTEYLRQLSLPYDTWARSKNSVCELLHLLKHATHILLLIKDSAIAEFANHLPRSHSQFFIHFSGSLATDSVYSAHPLMTFGKNLYSIDCYRNIPFITETEGPPLTVLLPGLTNPSYSIPSHKKAYYHALCVMSANFTAILWNKLFDELEKTFNIPHQIAIPYLKQTCKNLENAPGTALTGPLVRNDVNTIKANLLALENDPFQSIYQVFYEIYQRSLHEHS